MLINISINKTQVCLSNIFSKALIKKHQAAATLISNHESRNENNCSLKKCISGLLFYGCTSKLLPQKMYFSINKKGSKGFSQMIKDSYGRYFLASNQEEAKPSFLQYSFVTIFFR